MNAHSPVLLGRVEGDVDTALYCCSWTSSERPAVVSRVGLILGQDGQVNVVLLRRSHRWPPSAPQLWVTVVGAAVMSINVGADAVAINEIGVTAGSSASPVASPSPSWDQGSLHRRGHGHHRGLRRATTSSP